MTSRPKSLSACALTLMSAKAVCDVIRHFDRLCLGARGDPTPSTDIRLSQLATTTTPDDTATATRSDVPPPFDKSSVPSAPWLLSLQAHAQPRPLPCALLHVYALRPTPAPPQARCVCHSIDLVTITALSNHHDRLHPVPRLASPARWQTVPTAAKQTVGAAHTPRWDCVIHYPTT